MIFVQLKLDSYHLSATCNLSTLLTQEDLVREMSSVADPH